VKSEAKKPLCLTTKDGGQILLYLTTKSNVETELKLNGQRTTQTPVYPAAKTKV
jgi:hypothetical protein